MFSLEKFTSSLYVSNIFSLCELSYSKDVFSSYVEVVVFVLKSSCVNITLSCVSVAFDDTSSALATLIDSSAIINIIKIRNLSLNIFFNISFRVEF